MKETRIMLYVPEGIKKEECRKFIDSSYKKYYLRPRYLWRQLTHIRLFWGVKRMIKGFFAVLSL